MLSRPSPRRALTAGALALAVITPVAEFSDRPADAAPAAASASGYESFVRIGARSEQGPRASRAQLRRASAQRSARVRPAAHALDQAIQRSMQRQRARITTIRRQRAAAAAAAAERRRAALAAAEHRRAEQRRVERAAVRKRTIQHRRTRVVSRAATSGAVRPGMSAVLSYARAQVGKSYRSGGEGPYAFDCSGFTKRAYAQAGLRLPHSSGAQAAQAHNVSRASALPGDLVVGPGHVGIYMGGGMMIDAGNSRIGVVYRRLYRGLWIKRF